jgi:hypothetical protein
MTSYNSRTTNVNGARSIRRTSIRRNQLVAPSIRRISIRRNQFVAMYLLQLISRNLFVAMNDSQTF